MDKTLDEIIASKPKSGARRGVARRRAGRTQILGRNPASPVQKTRAAPVAVAAKVATGTQPQSADKIIVSNLPVDVNEAQIKELFTSTVGPLRDVTLHYDAAGRSKGVAAVNFSRKGDGNKAYQQYNNRLIDGKRPMKIEIVVDPARPVPLASRVAPAPAAATNGAPQRTGAVPARRRRGGRAGGAGAPRKERPAKSAADLDAEMEDYTAGASGPAAPAAAV